MRTPTLLFCAACVVLSAPSAGAAARPAAADEPALMQIEALQDRWQGRHHYLYDDDYRPTDSETVGAAQPDAQACAQQPVRMRRSDGSTTVKRLKRCD